MNIEMIEKVADAIPHREGFSMASFHTCIAAVACEVAGLAIETMNTMDVEDTAIKLMGISYTKAYDVFYASGWPDKFLAEYSQGRIEGEGEKNANERRAKLAADRLRYLVKTGE